MTRQSYYQHQWRQDFLSVEHQLVIEEVMHIRQNHRRMGTRKLLEKLQPFLLENQIKLGRDSLFNLLADNGLLVRKRKRTISTTMSYHRHHKWPNLIKEFIPTAPDQLYVSDITYWRTSRGFLFISLITDAFSRKIVGYNVADTLETIASRRALEMALNNRQNIIQDLIHHSDRGIQYCSAEYIQVLQKNKIKISMTETSEPTDNAIAERVNGILKDEYLNYHQIKSLKEARIVLEKSIQLYNEQRPHLSIGMLTPELVHHNNIKPDKLWKTYYRNSVILESEL